ncbi:MAG: TonB-dependent receptor plug domain-containing protein [Bacteroidetes bacterium]|nr:TonB-dependent receptor plug domain-containing protein [Bacteroidota bacterium]
MIGSKNPSKLYWQVPAGIRKLGRMLLCLVFSAGVAQAQIPDADQPLRLFTLDAKDLDTSFRPTNEKIVLGANRIAENSDEIAIKTYIITKEQIQQNGWSTLLDVLRTVPGFQISEPANALLGEAFLMRGMMGNLYTKILINGVPILPSAAPGQPLGGNLPIKQAERIEIVLGPATTVYGNDALAGVINIVIAEVERPVEARASIGLGSPNMDEFHLLLGGKVGSSRRVLQYQIFGSSRQMKDRNLNFGDSLLGVDTSLVRGNTNWSPDPNSNLPRLTDYGHQSRLLGASLQFGGFRLMGFKMYRKDHASLAQQPLEVSYSDPYTSIADNVSNLQLQFDKTLGKFWVHTNISYLDYRIDNNSAYLGVDHPISNGRNFIYAASQDLLAEQLANFKAKNWSVLVGGNYARRKGDAFQSYLIRPFDEGSVVFDSIAGGDVVENATSTTTNLGPKSVFNQYVYNDFGVFSQANFHTKRLNFLAGIRYDKQQANQPQLSWRLGGFGKLTEGIRIRAVVSRAYRAAGTFYRFNNYRYRAAPMELQPNYKREEADLVSETILNGEAGLVVKPAKWLQLEMDYFMYRLSNSIFFDQNFPTDSTGQGPNPNLSIGYRNTASSAVLQAAQMGAYLDFGWLKADLYAQLNIGREAIEGIDTLEAYRSVPGFQGNAAIHFQKEKWFRLSIFGRYVGRIENYYFAKLNDGVVSQSVGGFYNLDAALGRTFAKRIYLYLRVKNLTNSVSRGISTNFISTRQLHYIPQERRFFILGVNFIL